MMENEVDRRDAPPRSLGSHLIQLGLARNRPGSLGSHLIQLGLAQKANH